MNINGLHSASPLPVSSLIFYPFHYQADKKIKII